MSKKLTYGVPLTGLEEMKFSKYLQNNPKLPAPNTLSNEERKQLVIDWLALNSHHDTLHNLRSL